MRDFRDGKAMAHALRDALKAMAIETGHSECLELIAKAFGYENWNILSAKIEAAKPHEAGGSTLSQTGAQGSGPEKTALYCSFCGKSQHEVAGPAVFICDECVELCGDIIGPKGDQEILSLLNKDIESGNQAYPAALEHLSRMSDEDLTSYVVRCRKAAERLRLGLQHLQQSLAARRGDALEAADPLAAPRFAKLKNGTGAELRSRLEAAERGLERYEEAIRIGSDVLGGRGMPA